MSMLTDPELLRRMIAFESTSARSNQPIATFLAEYLAAAGMDVMLNDCGREKVNLIAFRGPQRNAGDADAEQGLVLSGHLDVVPATEPEWTSNPFQLIEHDGCYVGRGTADMKGFVALAVNIAAQVDAASLRHPLVLILTCDEEIGSLGARNLHANWPQDRVLPRSAIIGEPTSLRAVRMHKGHLTAKVRIRGRAAHSGSPHLGINAIEPAGTIISALVAKRAELASMRTPSSEFFSTVPFPVLNVARICGGGAINVVPERCEIDLGLRLLPGQDGEEAIAALRQSVECAAGSHDVQFEVINENPPLLTDDAAPIHRELCASLGQDDSLGVSFASDGGWLRRMGLDCVLFGPGTIEVAHRPNEMLPIDEWVRCRTILEQLVDRFCRADVELPMVSAAAPKGQNS